MAITQKQLKSMSLDGLQAIPNEDIEKFGPKNLELYKSLVSEKKKEKASKKMKKDEKPKVSEDLKKALKKKLRILTSKYENYQETFENWLKDVQEFQPERLNEVVSCDCPDCEGEFSDLIKEDGVSAIVENVINPSVYDDVDEISLPLKIQVSVLYTWRRVPKRFETKGQKKQLEYLQKKYGNVFCLNCKKELEFRLKKKWIEGFVELGKGNENDASKSFNEKGPSFVPLAMQFAYEARQYARREDARHFNY